MFRSAPPRRGRHCRAFGRGLFSKVSIRAPAKGATQACKHCDRGSAFRSAPPRGGRPRQRCVSGRRFGFDPRPREGGDTRGVGALWSHRVSIRAPARGATSALSDTRQKSLVSIRAPARGATGSSYHAVFSEETRVPARTARRCIPQPHQQTDDVKKEQKFQCVVACANLPGFFGTLEVRASDQTISGPMRSVAGFAPTCPTRRCQLEPG